MMFIVIPDMLGVFCYISKRIMTFFVIKKGNVSHHRGILATPQCRESLFPHYRVVYLQSRHRNPHFPTPPQRYYVVSHHDSGFNCGLLSVQRGDLLSRKGNLRQGKYFLSYMGKHYSDYFTDDLSRSSSSNVFYLFLLHLRILFFLSGSSYFLCEYI